MDSFEPIRALIRELAAENTEEGVARRGLACLLRAAGVQAGALYLYDDWRGELRLAAAQGLPLGFLRSMSRREAGAEPGPGPRAVLGRRPVWSETPHSELVEFCGGDELSARRLAAVAAVPLSFAERVLGVVELFAPAGADLSQAGDTGFQALCDLLALAIHKSQRAEEWDRCLEVSRSLFALSGATQASPPDTSALLPRIVQGAVRLVGGSAGCIAVWDQHSRVLTVRASLNLPDEFTRRPLTLDEGLLGKVVAENRAMVVHNYDTWPGADPVLASHGILSAVGVPLRLEGEAAGVLAVGTTHPSVHFAWEDVDALNSFADSAAVALGNARLLRQMQLKADHLTALLTISRRLSESLKLEAVLVSVLEEATRFLAATAGVIHLSGVPGSLEVAATFGDEDQWRRGESLARRAIRDGEPAADADSRHTYLTVPLSAGAKRIGALTCVREGSDRFTSDESAFLWTLAGHAAMAIENARLHEEAEEQSVRDALTGLYNVRRLQDRLVEETLRAGRYGHEFSFLMLDIDHFKRYNDTFGHLQGDAALRRVAEAVTRSVRTVDQVFRYGGEEICVLLPETPLGKALLVAERIRLAVASSSSGPGSRPDQRVTVSIGVASYPRDGSTPAELIARADEALYQAKAQGRNQVVAAAPAQGRTVTTSSSGLRGR